MLCFQFERNFKLCVKFVRTILYLYKHEQISYNYSHYDLSFLIKFTGLGRQLYLNIIITTNIEKFNAFEEYKSQTVYTKGNGFKPYARNIEFVLQRTNGLDRFQKNLQYVEWKNKKNYIQLKNLIMRQIGFQKDLLTLQ